MDRVRAPQHPRPSGARTPRAFRADIQGLRAVASLVLLYHLWPNRLGGGFVGVDVFFVISGFLITSHLLRAAARTGTRPGRRSGRRRIRRLLPASLLVLAVTRVATRLVAPETQWARPPSEVIARRAVRRELAAGARLGGLPRRRERALAGAALLVAVGGGAVLPRLADPAARCAGALGRRRGWRTGAVVGARSWPSSSPPRWPSRCTAPRPNPAAAYFVTPTRIWELASAALLASPPPGPGAAAPRPRLRALAWAGLGRIACAALSYTGAHPVPRLAAAAARAGGGRW